MPSTLPGQISSQQLAALLSISQCAVFQRAKKGGWPRVFKRGKGRATHLYLVSGLPEDIRATLATRIKPKFVGAAAQAGYTRAKELVEETQAAADARRKAKEAGLAAYERLSEPRKIEANARQENLTVTGDIEAGGDVSDGTRSMALGREFYNSHYHTSTGSPPNPQQ